MSYEQQLPPNNSPAELLECLVRPAPTVIALEGGPCSGKTTLMAAVAEKSGELDFPLELVPEVATERIAGLQNKGVSITEMAENDRPAYLKFEQGVIGTVLANIERAKAIRRGTNAVILVDRADIASYVTEEEYRQILDDLRWEKPPLQSVVDKVVFLPSVACERPELYAKLAGTNSSRLEATAEDAAAVSAANLREVQTHPELEISWGGDFKDKVGRLAAALLQPELEGEIKQSVPAADAEEFCHAAEARGDLLNVISIEQSYYQMDGREFRLRSSTCSDGARYYHFTVKSGDGVVRGELQRSLTRQDYELLGRAGNQLGNAVSKQRHVILDEPNSPGRRCLWFADRYIEPNLDHWHFETEVDNEAEAKELDKVYAATRQRATESARSLAFIS
jgi:hypothetical protein